MLLRRKRQVDFTAVVVQVGQRALHLGLKSAVDGGCTLIHLLSSLHYGTTAQFSLLIQRD